MKDMFWMTGILILVVTVVTYIIFSVAVHIAGIIYRRLWG